MHHSRLRILSVVAVLAVLVSVVSCASAPSPYLDGKAVDKKNFGSPATDTLLFGRICRPEYGLYTLPFDRLDFIQVNPQFKPMWIRAAIKGDYAYVLPVPAGSSMHLVAYTFNAGNYTFNNEMGFHNSEGLTTETTKPGLQYIGSWELSVRDDDEAMFPKQKSFRPSKKNYELKSLAAILPSFIGTDWEPLIRARMEELTHEK